MSCSFQSTINVASYHGGNDCWVFGAVRPGDRIHSSILGVGGAVLRRTHRQVGSHVPEHHWMGELLTVIEYLIATETVGAVPKEAHGHLEGVL